MNRPIKKKKKKKKKKKIEKINKKIIYKKKVIKVIKFNKYIQIIKYWEKYRVRTITIGYWQQACVVLLYAVQLETYLSNRYLELIEIKTLIELIHLIDILWKQRESFFIFCNSSKFCLTW